MPQAPTVKYDYEWRPNGVYDPTREPWVPRWLIDLVGIDYFCSVYSIDYYADDPAAKPMSEEDVDDLASLRSLRELTLQGRSDRRSRAGPAHVRCAA